MAGTTGPQAVAKSYGAMQCNGLTWAGGGRCDRGPVGVRVRGIRSPRLVARRGTNQRFAPDPAFHPAEAGWNGRGNKRDVRGCGGRASPQGPQQPPRVDGVDRPQVRFLKDQPQSVFVNAKQMCVGRDQKGNLGERGLGQNLAAVLLRVGDQAPGQKSRSETLRNGDFGGGQGEGQALPGKQALERGIGESPLRWRPAGCECSSSTKTRGGTSKA